MKTSISEKFLQVSDSFDKMKKEMYETSKEFIKSVLSNDNTKQCGNLTDLSIRIKKEYKFSGEIVNTLIDYVEYDKENDNIFVIDNDDEDIIDWDDLFFDDMVIIANAIYMKYNNLNN